MESPKIIILTAPEGHIMHRKGDRNFDTIRRVACLETARDDWEVIPESDIPATPPADYAAKVEALIRQRYTTGEELAILRQRDAKPEEFADYYAFAEQCKREAKNQNQTNPAVDENL